MPADPEPRLDLAYCGNDCSACPRYLATQSGRLGRLREVAALWHRAGFRDRVIEPEEIACHGCASVPSCRLGVRECAQARAVASCADCREYPCAKLEEAFIRAERHQQRCRACCTAEDYQFLEITCRLFTRRENLECARRAALGGKNASHGSTEIHDPPAPG